MNILIRPPDTKKNTPTFGRKKDFLPTTTSGRRTERERTEDNETEQRRDERVLLDRVAGRLGGLSGRPSGRPVSDPPKTPLMGPGLARARNRQILNRNCIEKYTDFDGRRIREFCPSRTCPDLVIFRGLGGTDFGQDFFASSFRGFVSFRRLWTPRSCHLSDRGERSFERCVQRLV